MDDAEKVAAATMPSLKKPMPPRPQSGLRRAVRPEDLGAKPAPRPSAIELDIEVDLSTLEPVIEVQHLHDVDFERDPRRERDDE